MGGGAGLAGVPNAKGVEAFSAATGVLGAPKVKGAGLTVFVSFLSGPEKVNGAGMFALASPSDVVLKVNKLFETGFGACTSVFNEIG